MNRDDPIANRLSTTVASGLVRYRAALVVLALVSGLWAAWVGRRVEFDRSLERMFSASDPILPPFARLKRTFDAGEVVLAAYADDSLFTPDGIERSRRVGELLEALPGVADVVGPHSPVLGQPLASSSNLFSKALREKFAGFTHSSDGRTAGLVCILEREVDHTATVEAMRSIVARETNGVIAGEPVMIVDGFRYVEEDGRLLGLISTISLSAVILLCFRSLRWLVIPLAVVLWTRVMTQGLLVAAGFRLTMVSSMLTAIVTVVAVAAVMHVVLRFREARAAGTAPIAAMRLSIALLAAPVFWSCLTDAMGFASLVISGVEPIRDFGLMSATGAALVLVAIALCVPGMALLGRWDGDPRHAWGEGRLSQGLTTSLSVVERWPRAIGIVTLVLAAVLAAGAWRLEVETDFTKNFRADSPIAESYDFIETHLGGAGVWDVVLPAPDRLTMDYLRRVRKLQQRLRDELGSRTDDDRAEHGRVTSVLSIVDVVDAVPAASLIVLTDPARLRSFHPLARTLYNVDPENPKRAYYRIMLRAAERQPSAAKDRLISEVNRIVGEEFPPEDDRPGGEVSGYFVLLARLIDSILADQWSMFFLATGGIAVAVAIAFRSAGLVVAALAANLLPILVALGIWGWLGLRVNLGTAMIAAISMGLSVDSSIHYLAEYRRHRAGGASLTEALARAQQGAGRAMTFATLALVVGFLALLPSNFIPTAYFGALTALALFGSLVGNLFVLPLLVRWLDK